MWATKHNVIINGGTSIFQIGRMHVGAQKRETKRISPRRRRNDACESVHGFAFSTQQSLSGSEQINQWILRDLSPSFRSPVADAVHLQPTTHVLHPPPMTTLQWPPKPLSLLFQLVCLFQRWWRWLHLCGRVVETEGSNAFSCYLDSCMQNIYDTPTDAMSLSSMSRSFYFTFENISCRLLSLLEETSLACFPEELYSHADASFSKP